MQHPVHIEVVLTLLKNDEFQHEVGARRAASVSASYLIPALPLNEQTAATTGKLHQNYTQKHLLIGPHSIFTIYQNANAIQPTKSFATETRELGWLTLG